ncbi:hypothetical protein Hanom_Chr17g01545631 [Helianthus anomalus]
MADMQHGFVHEWQIRSLLPCFQQLFTVELKPNRNVTLFNHERYITSERV